MADIVEDQAVNGGSSWYFSSFSVSSQLRFCLLYFFHFRQPFLYRIFHLIAAILLEYS